MTIREQLERWVAGEWLHDPETGRCTPDFGCCMDELRATKEIREAFMVGTEEQKALWLYSWMVEAMQAQCSSLGIEPAQVGSYKPELAS